MRPIALLLLIALPAGAQPVRNPGAVAAAVHGGPSTYAGVLGYLEPGAGAVVDGCDAIGRWCLLATDRGIVGWVDTDAAPLVRRDADVRSPDPAPPVPPPAIEVTPLPDAGGGPRPLPGAILDAVPPVADRAVPGARLPRLLSLTAPMRNVTGGRVNLRAGPGTAHAVVGDLGPGEGGPIEICDASEQWCLIRASSGPGWVKMTLMGERRLAVGAR